MRYAAGDNHRLSRRQGRASSATPNHGSPTRSVPCTAGAPVAGVLTGRKTKRAKLVSVSSLAAAAKLTLTLMAWSRSFRVTV